MAISYKKLWKLLIDSGMMKKRSSGSRWFEHERDRQAWKKPGRVYRGFAEEQHSVDLMKALRGRKPFRTFKDRAIDMGLDQAYYAFRSQAFKEIAREWCVENEIPFTE